MRDAGVIRNATPPARAGASPSRFKFTYDDLVAIAPDPRFAGFDRTYQRMTGCVKMPARMPVGRRIAAADVSARKTKPQIYPRLAKLHAVLAIVDGRLENAGLAQVRATGGHDRAPRTGRRKRARIELALR